jgi:protein tyrosine phosphatase (PTP) superfamily phosphohydrolase (DUF442 family)
MRRTLFGLVATGLLLGQAGCKSCNGCPDSPPGGAPAPFIGPGPGPAPMPQGAPWLPEPPSAPAPVGVQSKSVDPAAFQSDTAWKAGNGPSVRLYPPEVVENDGTTKIIPLVTPDPFGADKPSKVKEKAATKEPPLLPLGIPQFAQARDKVANGRRPSLDDGLGWLQTNGYKTILFLHEPGALDSADRQQVEKRGMTFVSMEVSAMTLSQKSIDDFNRIVGDGAGLPLFVYDTDGSLTGGLWYLHFRQTQGATDEAARKLARPLGLREDGDLAHQQMWQSAQKLVKE